MTISQEKVKVIVRITSLRKVQLSVSVEVREQSASS